ncbi:MAG: glycerol kinase GlpK [Eubacterium sp.]|nr:glycerol kinase GlpK [Eubacterium sp.]MDY5498303.1 glycerol kinase GlpK [Anaerobutyricum sp.]
MAKYILVMDQGTTGSRGVVYDEKGKKIAYDYEEYEQYYPQSGWWEQSGKALWNVTLRTAQNAIQKAGLKGTDIACLGITNQRETTTIWDKVSGEPIYNTIVWGCRRGAKICQNMIDQGYNDLVNEKTGLIIDPTYSASKIRWILDNVPGAQKRAEDGELYFGNVDSWLIYKLTKGRVHAEDYSNAARTMLFNAHELKWDDELLKIFNVPKCMLPEVKPSVGIFGYTDPEFFGAEIPITGVAGDQSAALFGQACFDEGDAKNTYGTSAVPLMYTGDTAPKTEKGLLTVAWGKDGKVKYSMGASILIAGQVIKWIRDQMNFIDAAAQSEEMSLSIPDNGGVYFVPAFTGLGAPHWDPKARGMLIGITAATTKEQITRAAVESMAYQTRDLLEEMEKNSGIKLKELKVDGGAAKNDFLLQFQADILNCKVVRPKDTETTALGACYLAGLGAGIFKDEEEIKGLWEADRVFEPQMDDETRERLYSQWCKAVEKSKGWLD